jgi:hypothetical protein
MLILVYSEIIAKAKVPIAVMKENWEFVKNLANEQEKFTSTKLGREQHILPRFTKSFSIWNLSLQQLLMVSWTNSKDEIQKNSECPFNSPFAN